jgi:hypothetical protein
MNTPQWVARPLRSQTACASPTTLPLEFREIERECVHQPAPETKPAAAPVVEEPVAGQAVGEEPGDDFVGLAQPSRGGSEEVDAQRPGVHGHDVMIDIAAAGAARSERGVEPRSLGTGKRVRSHDVHRGAPPFTTAAAAFNHNGSILRGSLSSMQVRSRAHAAARKTSESEAVGNPVP